MCSLGKTLNPKESVFTVKSWLTKKKVCSIGKTPQNPLSPADQQTAKWSEDAGPTRVFRSEATAEPLPQYQNLPSASHQSAAAKSTGRRMTRRYIEMTSVSSPTLNDESTLVPCPRSLYNRKPTQPITKYRRLS